jgi:hypothetical protein
MVETYSHLNGLDAAGLQIVPNARADHAKEASDDQAK